MRKNFSSNSWLYPMPVLIVATYDEQGVPNAMNAAWGGIFSDEMIGICLSENHKTTKNILANHAFYVNLYKEYSSLKLRELEGLPRFG